MIKGVVLPALVSILMAASAAGYEFADNIRDLMESAKTLSAQGQLAEAELEYENVLQIDPAHKDAALPLFDLYVKRGAVDEAGNLLDRIRTMGVDAGKISELEGKLKNTKPAPKPSWVAAVPGARPGGSPGPSGAPGAPAVNMTAKDAGLSQPNSGSVAMTAKDAGMGKSGDALLDELEEDLGPAPSPAAPGKSLHASLPSPGPSLSPPPPVPASPAPKAGGPSAAASPAPGASVAAGSGPASSPHPAPTGSASPAPGAGKPSPSPLPSPSSPLSPELEKIRKGSHPTMKAPEYLEQGKRHYQSWQATKSNEDLARAEAYLEGAAIKGPSDPEAQFRLALLLLDKAAAGDKSAKARARERFEAALRASPPPKMKAEIEGFLKGL